MKHYMKFALPEIAMACAVAMASVLIATIVLGYAAVPIEVPTGYTGDALYYGMLIKSVIENGWYMTNPHLGAPFGLDMGPFPLVEDTHFLMLKIIGMATGDFGSTYTLFYLLSFATAAISAFVVMRSIGINRALSACGALLFSLQSYHFLRGGHLFLASYYSVPIFVWVALHLHELPKGEVRWSRLFLLSVLLVIASTSGVYYAFFGCVLIGFSAISASISQRRWRPMAVGAAIGALIFLSVLANLAPHFRSINTHADDPTLTERKPMEAEIYGLKLIQMMLPSAAHRQPEVRALSSSYSRDTPLVNENATSSLGTIALLGFFLSIAALLVHRERPNPALLVRLGSMNAVAFAFATVGGAGVVFAWLVTPQFRGLNRISIVIAFISLCALFWGVQRLTERTGSSLRRRVARSSLAMLIALIGWWDQVPSWKPAIAESNRIAFHDDAVVGAAVMHLLPAGSRVYQLPYIAFPETPPLFSEGHTGLARRYLHTTEIAWSYGAMKGREADAWIREMEVLPVPARLPKLAASGFDAVMVERRAYEDAGREIENQISKLTGPPVLVCPDQSCALYRLEQSPDAKGTPLLIATLGNGFTPWENGPNGGRYTRSSGDRKSRIYLLNPLKAPIMASLHFSIATQRDSNIAATLDDQEFSSWTLQEGESMRFDKPIKLQPGISTLKFCASATTQNASTQNSLRFDFQLSELSIRAMDSQGRLLEPANWTEPDDEIFGDVERSVLSGESH